MRIVRARVRRSKLPAEFAALVRVMPPQAIVDDVQHANTVEMIDRLMRCARLTRGQALYLETLTQLVMAYEQTHHSVDSSDLKAVGVLEQLLADNGMNASDLAKLLRVHSSMGSKILNGERSLTVEHIRKLAARFSVNPSVFID